MASRRNRRNSSAGRPDGEENALLRLPKNIMAPERRLHVLREGVNPGGDFPLPWRGYDGGLARPLNALVPGLCRPCIRNRVGQQTVVLWSGNRPKKSFKRSRTILGRVNNPANIVPGCRKAVRVSLGGFLPQIPPNLILHGHRS